MLRNADGIEHRPTSTWPRIAACAALLATFLLSCASPPPPEAEKEEQVAAPATTIFLVRHAEKAKQPRRNPDLTQLGTKRADDLAHALSGVPLDRVLTTNFARTKNTALPTAAQQGLELTLYDPRNLEALAQTLTAEGGTSLVVGHSNTTPALVHHLGGDPGSPIDEATEFNRLYLLRITPSGTETLLLRYGP